MSYGSNQAVQDDEDAYRERLADDVAHHAARLVACGDMPRREAIKAVIEWYRAEAAANGDVTGVASIENTFPSPSKAAPKVQVDAIALELQEDAWDAVDTLP